MDSVILSRIAQYVQLLYLCYGLIQKQVTTLCLEDQQKFSCTFLRPNSDDKFPGDAPPRYLIAISFLWQRHLIEDVPILKHQLDTDKQTYHRSQKKPQT